jgi:hypothetical protein
MRLKLALYVLLCICCVACSSLAAPARKLPEISDGARFLADEIQLERERTQLPQVQYDSVQSGVVERRLPEILEELSGALGDSVTQINLDEHIYDWHKVCFAVRGASLAEATMKLLGDDLFLGTLGRKSYTHLVTAYSDSVYPSIAIVALVERFVHFGICTARTGPSGAHSTTLNGHAPGADSLRFVLYKGTELPGEYAGTETIAQAIRLREGAEFSVEFPLSQFGFGEYRMAVYVKMSGRKEYLLSSWMPFTVNPPEIRYKSGGWAR